jgi:hypothetical protein
MSHQNMELLLRITGVMLFAGLWFPLVARTRGLGPWIEIPLASVPLLLLVGVCVAFRRKYRD